MYDAFNGTGQPTTVDGLQLVIDEVGWQTDTQKYTQYFHNENVATVSEAQQTQYVKEATEKYFACDPTIATVNWFNLVDETSRDGRDQSGNAYGGGWQAGLLTAGGQGVSTPKQAFAGASPDWALGRAACKGPQIVWAPAKGSSAGGKGRAKGNGAGSTTPKKPTPPPPPATTTPTPTPTPCKKGQGSSKQHPCDKPTK